ncbi:CXXC-20-CXXC protein [Rossellomorea marisflavi]
MTTCTNCQHRWTKRDIWKVGFSKEGKDCPGCGTRQYISAETQGIMTLGFLSLIAILLFPFIVKLSGEKEPLW